MPVKKLWANFLRDPAVFMAKYGANVAGPVWISGSALQFLIGAVVLSPRQIASSIINLASPGCHTLFGHKNWGVSVALVLGIIGTELAVHPGLVNGEAGTIFGFVAFVAAAMLGIFSPSLTKKFGAAKNALLRETIGNPRRMMGLSLFTLSRLPIIFTGLAHGRGLAYIAPFIVWGAGDLIFSLSRPNME